MATVEKFEIDQWVPVQAMTLNQNDLIRFEGQILVVTEKPFKTGGKITLPAIPYEDVMPITLAVGQHGHDYICMAMDYTNATHHTFDDGTGILADFESGLFFSPRLPVNELEAFCEQHQSHYAAFFSQHEVELDRGHIAPMESFWNELKS